MTPSKTGVKIIGISGGSCSGKTTLAQQWLQFLGPSRCGLVFQDSYYIDQSHRFKEDGGEVNFDHPDSLEFSLLATHLQALRAGESVAIPIYDFVTHKRVPQTQRQEPHAVILVDGTLILSQPSVRACLDGSVFVDASEELRFTRRKTRDVRERGRDIEGVIRQFQNHVKPMHDLFVEPSRQFATQVYPGDTRDNAQFLELLRRFGF
ncbi:MAG: uridine kinase [Bdellovibrionales bacterium]|nr:uridine kinase [Bdellovibrionales bacterium]